MKNLNKVFASLLLISVFASFESFSVFAKVGDIELGKGKVLYEADFENIESLDDLSMSYVKSANATYEIVTSKDDSYLADKSTDGTVVKFTTGELSGTHSYIRLPVEAMGDDGEGVYLVECDLLTTGAGGMGVKFLESQNDSEVIPDAFYRITDEMSGQIYFNGGSSNSLVGVNNDPHGNYTTDDWTRAAYIYDSHTGIIYTLENGLYKIGNYTAYSKENTPKVKYFLFGACGTKGGYIDNIKITKLDSSKMIIHGFTVVAEMRDTKVGRVASYTTLADAKADSDGAVFAGINGYNSTNDTVTADFIVAAYDKDGLLVDVINGSTGESFTTKSPLGSYFFELPKTFFGDEINEIKFFALDGLTMDLAAEIVSFN